MTGRKKTAFNLIAGYLFTLIISSSVWCVVNMSNYVVLSGTELWRAVFADFAEGAIESFFIFCFSVYTCKLLIRFLGNHKSKELSIVASVGAHVFLDTCFIFGVAYLYYLIYPFEKNLFYHIMLTDFIVMEILSSTYLVLHLVGKNREEENARILARAESRKNELIALHTKLDMLALQTNNHFIFNSFSTAAGLIRHDPEAAETFIKRLSFMYRYITRSSDFHIVPLRDELEFVDNYVHMLTGRYSGIEVNISPELRCMNAFVPPVSIQILVENAVKHNGHGSGHRLSIDVSLDDEYLVVTNNIIKRIDEEEGTHSGLANLKRRYELLTDRDVLVEDDGNTFRVRLPLIFEEDLCHESFDNRG